VKFNLSKNLLGGLLVVVALLVIICIVSFVSIGTVEKNADSLKFSADYDEAVMSLIITVYQQQDAITDYSLTHEEEVLAEIEAFSKRFKDQVKVLRNFAKTEAEKKTVESLIKAHADFETLGVQMSKAFVSGTREKGLDLMEKFDRAVNKQEKMMAEVEKVAMTIADKSQKQAKASASRARTVLFVISLIAIVIGSGGAFFIARSISRPVKALAEATKKIADGDLTHTVNIANRDEIGGMAELFNNMSHNFREVIQNIQETSLEISAISEKTSAINY
jgi:methyl-accepting chemotaxis protein